MNNSALAVIVLTLLPTAARAETCTITDWRYSLNKKFDRADLQGTTTCEG